MNYNDQQTLQNVNFHKLLSREVFSTLRNIYDWTFCKNGKRLKASNYFLKNIHVIYVSFFGQDQTLHQSCNCSFVNFSRMFERITAYSENKQRK